VPAEPPELPPSPAPVGGCAAGVALGDAGQFGGLRAQSAGRRAIRPHPGRGPGRPLLPAALRPVWRAAGELQLGLDPARAVVVGGVDEPIARFLLRLDGTRTEAETLASAAAGGLDPLALGNLLAELRDEGVLGEVGPGDPAGSAQLVPPAGSAAAAHAFGSAGAAGRLGPDLASLSLLGGLRAPLETVRRRRAATVVVHGAGRVGSSVATLLAAAGVGRVHVADSGPVRPGDVAPAGIAAADVDRSRATAVAEAVRRTAPEVRSDPPQPGRRPDLVVLASVDPVDTELRAVLQGGLVAHLVAGVRETTAVIGPLVVPGRTSCLRCADLHRTDRDPAWPVVAAQLTGIRRRRAEPCDVVLATVAAGIAALQALTHLEGRPAPSAGATLELALPDWRLRRRSWPAHQRCGCGAAA
jgi:hypothetical protein